MKSLLLLDADVAIHFHELGWWESIIKQYKIHLTSTVIGEIKHYTDSQGNQIKIDLSQDIQCRNVVEIGAPPQEISKILSLLKDVNLDGLHAGELESITYIKSGKTPDLKIGIKDGLAIKALSFLELEDSACPLEEILKYCGILRPKDKIKYEYSAAKFKKLVYEGKQLLVEKEKIKTPNK